MLFLPLLSGASIYREPRSPGTGRNDGGHVIRRQPFSFDLLHIDEGFWAFWPPYLNASTPLSASSHVSTNKYIGPPYCRAKMYAGRVAYCPVASHKSTPTKQTDGQTDARRQRNDHGLIKRISFNRTHHWLCEGRWKASGLKDKNSGTGSH